MPNDMLMYCTYCKQYVVAEIVKGIQRFFTLQRIDFTTYEQVVCPICFKSGTLRSTVLKGDIHEHHEEGDN